MDSYLTGERENSTKKAGENKADLNAKWDAFLDLGLRRFVYSSFAGGFAGILLFRSPVTRWASVAFGAGVGIGSAYTECSQKSDGSPEKRTRSIRDNLFEILSVFLFILAGWTLISH